MTRFGHPKWVFMVLDSMGWDDKTSLLLINRLKLALVDPGGAAVPLTAPKMYFEIILNHWGFQFSTAFGHFYFFVTMINFLTWQLIVCKDIFSAVKHPAPEYIVLLTQSKWHCPEHDPVTSLWGPTNDLCYGSSWSDNPWSYCCYLHSVSWHNLFRVFLSVCKILKDSFLFWLLF